MATTPEDSYKLRPRRSKSAVRSDSVTDTSKTIHTNSSLSTISDGIHQHHNGSSINKDKPIRSNGIYNGEAASQLTDTPKRSIMQRHLIKQIEQHCQRATDTPGEQYSTPVGRPDVDASFRTEDKISPMLAKLRMTPGKLLRETQSILKRKHEESQRRLDKLNVGGGVSLWPEMESMRLTSDDVRRLVVVCISLCGLVVCLFYILHGSTVKKLLEFQHQLSHFPFRFTIDILHGQDELDLSLIHWHMNYKKIVDDIHESFDVRKVPVSYILYILIYIATIGVLLFYLIDNMFAKSKLSPNRIRRWVCLLTLTGTWTFLMLLTLAICLWTEVAIETNIHLLSAQLAEIIPTDFSCDKFNTILQYWRTRCLPPTTHGTISIFGVVPVRDVTYYLQYYSIPIITVLLTPVFKLIVAVMTVYNIGTKQER